MEICSIKLLEIPAGVLEMMQLCCYSPTAGLISTVSQISVIASDRSLNGSGSMEDQGMEGVDSPLGWVWNMGKESKLTKNTEPLRNNKLAL